ncbi:MAG TPA: sugar porter family MFS transporter [Labilithrix sp.]|nr:sugar porter family MFS transporter [Labilithrix sp.]
MRAPHAAARSSFIAGAAAIGGFLFGFDTAVINGTVAALRHEFGGGDVAIGLTVSAALIGSAIGAHGAGTLADRWGRTRAMAVTAAVFVVSGVLSGAALSLIDLAAWRLLGGVAIGAASVLAPAYIAEIAPAELRGRLGSLQQLAIVVGIFAALLGDYELARRAGSASQPFAFGLPAWRWMFWTEVLPALAYGAAAFFLPESPRWLVAKGREDEARRILALLGEEPDGKLVEIRETIQRDRPTRLRDLRGPGPLGLQRIVWVGLAVAVLQQLVGINVIFYYSSVLWQAVGFSEHDALFVTVITSVTNIVTTFIAIAAVDRLGRRPLLIAGSAGMAISLAMMAFLFSRAHVDAAGRVSLDPSSGLTALIAANVFVFSFGFSWGPVVWVLLGEMFPNRIRAKALGLAATAQWIANFLVTVSFPPLQRLGLGLAYGTYTFFAFASLFIVLRWVPETRGKELEAM